MAYRYGKRKQMTMLPRSIDEYVDEKAPVRAYDAIIGSLDFDKLGIKLSSDKVGSP